MRCCHVRKKGHLKCYHVYDFKLKRTTRCIVYNLFFKILYGAPFGDTHFHQTCIYKNKNPLIKKRKKTQTQNPKRRIPNHSL